MQRDKFDERQKTERRKALRELFNLPLFVERPLNIRLNWQCEGRQGEVEYWKDCLQVKWGRGYLHKDDEMGRKISFIYSDDGEHIGYLIDGVSFYQSFKLKMIDYELKICCDQISNALSILFGNYSYSVKNTQYKFIYEHFDQANRFVGFDIIDKNLFETLDIEKIEFKFQL